MNEILNKQHLSMFLRYTNFNDTDEDFNVDYFDFYVAM